MITIRNPSDVAAIANPAVREFVAFRFQQLTQSAIPTAQNFSHVGYFVVVEAGEAASEIEQVVGFKILNSLFDNLPFGHLDFQPCSEILEAHDYKQHRIYEMVFIGSDDGAFTCLVIPEEEGINADLLAMCHAFATPAMSTP